MLPKAFRYLPFAIEHHDAEVAAVDHVELAVLADRDVARQVEFARTGAAPPDVHPVRAGRAVEDAHDVLLARHAADVHRVDQRALRIHRDAGQPLELVRAADLLQQGPVRVVHDDLAQADVGDVDAALGVDVDADRLHQRARSLAIADAIRAAAGNVEDQHEALHGVGHEHLAAVHGDAIGLAQLVPGADLARDLAAQFRRGVLRDDVGRPVQRPLVDEARFVRRRRKHRGRGLRPRRRDRHLCAAGGQQCRQREAQRPPRQTRRCQ